MRSFTFWTFIIGLHCAGLSQVLGDAYWNSIRDRADSVVISRFGTAFFIDHIFPPIDPLDYIVVGEHSLHWRERDTISRAPTYCHFEYDIGFDTLHASRLNIMLYITPEGHLIEDEDLRGFVRDTAPLEFHTDLDGFIALARNNGFRGKRSEAFRDLRWIPLDTTQRVHSGGDGKYELVLGRVRGKKKENIGGSTYTYQFVDTIVFDPFTGEVLRKEKRRQTLSIACGREFL